MLLVLSMLVLTPFAFGHSTSEKMCLSHELLYMRNQISYNSYYENIVNKLPNKEKIKFLDRLMEYLDEESKLNNEAETLLKNEIINNFKLCEKQVKLELKIQKFWTKYIHYITPKQKK